MAANQGHSSSRFKGVKIGSPDTPKKDANHGNDQELVIPDVIEGSHEDEKASARVDGPGRGLDFSRLRREKQQVSEREDEPVSDDSDALGGLNITLPGLNDELPSSLPEVNKSDHHVSTVPTGLPIIFPHGDSNSPKVTPKVSDVNVGIVRKESPIPSKEVVANQAVRSERREDRLKENESDNDLAAVTIVKRGHNGGLEKPKRGEKESKKVVLGPDGEELWKVKSNDKKGKLAVSELNIFENLNRRRDSVFLDADLREVFNKVDGVGSGPGRKALLSQAIFGDEALDSRSRKRLTFADFEVIRFLAKFKFASSRHLSAMLLVTEDTAIKRLRRLRYRGLVVKKELYGTRPIWLLTEAGVIVSGLNLVRVRESTLSFAQMPHQFVVNHVAGALWSGKFNVLDLEEFPLKNRFSDSGEPIFGETLVSEFEIQSAFSGLRRGEKSDVFKTLIRRTEKEEFDKYGEERRAGREALSPELAHGNEYMWAIITEDGERVAYHVPDLVVVRSRSAGGKPNSIAVEVELANKAYALYERALRIYRSDSTFYGMIVWIVKSKGAENKLRRALDTVSNRRPDFRERVKIIPLLTADGVLSGKPEWSL
jgi:hypothetical protein